MFVICVSASVAATAAAATPITVDTSDQSNQRTLSPADMFVWAEQAERSGDLTSAQRILRALASNRALEIRSEARFRHAMLLAKNGLLTNAATLLRAILDEQPTAQRVRIELAGILARIGDEPAARHELRAVQSGGLPPQVAQMLDRFSAALRARKPFGGSLQIAMATDSNINRSTRSDTLGTVIGDFLLDEDAKARSGRGLSVDAQGYRRIALGSDHSLLVTLSEAADLYREKQFNDVALSAKAGPELRLGDTRLNLTAELKRRWFGNSVYTSSAGTEADVSIPLSRVTQLRTYASADRVTNHRNDLESGWSLASSAAVEIALSPRSGAGVAVTGSRQAFRGAAYSTTSGQATLFGYREIGRTTVSAAASLGRLNADERIPLFPARRQEWLWRGTIGATARQLTYGGFAPTVQLTLERNSSAVEIYDYRRTAVEFGISRAF